MCSSPWWFPVRSALFMRPFYFTPFDLYFFCQKVGSERVEEQSMEWQACNNSSLADTVERGCASVDGTGQVLMGGRGSCPQAPSLLKIEVSVPPVLAESLCAMMDTPSSRCHSPPHLPGEETEVGRSQSHRTDVYAPGHHAIPRCYLTAGRL